MRCSGKGRAPAEVAAAQVGGSSAPPGSRRGGAASAAPGSARGAPRGGMLRDACRTARGLDAVSTGCHSKIQSSQSGDIPSDVSGGRSLKPGSCWKFFYPHWAKSVTARSNLSILGHCTPASTRPRAAARRVVSSHHTVQTRYGPEIRA